MPFEITMPQLGLTMEQGAVVEWYVAEGDSISEGQEIFSVETDKSVVSVEAHQEGILARLLVPAGQTVPVGTCLSGGLDSSAIVCVAVSSAIASTGRGTKPNTMRRMRSGATTAFSRMLRSWVTCVATWSVTGPVIVVLYMRSTYTAASTMPSVMTASCTRPTGSPSGSKTSIPAAPRAKSTSPARQARPALSTPARPDGARSTTSLVPEEPLFGGGYHAQRGGRLQQFHLCSILQTF